MKKLYRCSLFIFRRDLRLVDNCGLNEALRLSEQVIPAFIIDPAQVGKGNAYRSMNALQFMAESLYDLDQQLRDYKSQLYIWRGKPTTIVKHLIQESRIQALFCNRDYTPFSIARDQALQEICMRTSCPFIQCNDLVLTEPEDILNKSGKFFSKFTPFFNTARKNAVANPQRLPHTHFFKQKLAKTLSIKATMQLLIPQPNNLIHTHGGSKEAHKLLRKISKLTHYAQTRDTPSLPTTSLSAHLKFGTVSIRQVYHRCTATTRTDRVLMQQLYWRDYYTHAIFHSPHMLGHAGNPTYNKLVWRHDTKLFDLWCHGKTGFPIIDAGMRQLNSTGFMHNRIRMLTASFLVKDLRIDWRWGERYFAQQLVDYDPAVNNGNWQWIAATGYCTMPYFRIFNPWIQQKKYDRDCVYIKEWISELRAIEPKTIHLLYRHTVAHYPPPIINHDQEAARTKIWYRDAIMRNKKQ